MKKINFINILLLVFVKIVFCQSLWNGTGHISTSSQINWYKAGLLDKSQKAADFILNITDFGAVPNDAVDDFNAIVNAIDSARNLDGLTIIYFPSGTFNINSTISLNSNDKDIVFQGNGTSSTILEFRVGRNNVCFQIAGSVIGDKVKLDSGMSKGTNIISVSNVSNFSVGDWIHYFEYYFPVEKVEKWPKCVGQVTRINSINGNKLIIQEKTSKSYSSQYGPYVEKINPIKNIGIEKLKIKRLDTGKSDDGVTGSNLNFVYAVNCWVKGVELERTCEHHIKVNFSAHLEISGCYFNSANSHNDGGYGYGVCLQRSTNFCLIENNIFRDLRHSMLVQGRANSNVFEYNYSREAYGLVTNPIIPDQPFLPPDICIHGRYPFANLFEENNVEYIKADDEHGMNGPFNTFVRNIVYNDNENYLYFIRLVNAKHCNILGCNNGNGNKDPFVYSPLGYEYTPDTDIYGFEMYIDNIPYYPWNHNNSYIAGERPYLLMKDISYFYNSRPDFLDVSYGNYSWPSCGPAVYPDDNITQSIPA